MPDVTAVHQSLAERSFALSDGDSPAIDTLRQRVDGQFTGTTDEIIQWAACKWGLPDNLLRAIAVRESTWFSSLHYQDGEVYYNRGYGDDIVAADVATTTYCNGVAAAGHDYQLDPRYAPGLCPKTFSITGIMAWQNPTWGPMLDNQNGSFPFSRDSTAFAEDYIGWYLRGCFRGFMTWLHPTSGDIWGCVGAWYSGDWHSVEADAYITRVKAEITNHTWLTAAFDDALSQYDETCYPLPKGCPV